MDFNLSETINIDKHKNIYENIYIFNWPLKIAIFSTVLNILFFTPLFFAIAWYEKYGTNQNRTLLNQLVSSICWITIVQNISDLPLGIFMNLFGPLNLEVCTVFLVYKSALILNTVILLIFITLVKYVYIFVLKNPAGINSEIWCRFTNMFSVGFSLLEQSVFLFLPGRQPAFIYVCAGIDHSIIKGHHKVNFLFLSITAISIIFYWYTFLRKYFFNKNTTSTTFLLPKQVKTGWTLPPIHHKLESLTLANFGTILLYILTMVPIVLSFLLMDNLPADKLSKYPYFVLVHLFVHGTPLLRNFLLAVVFLSKSKTMRTVLLREFLDKLKSIFSNVTFKSYRSTNVISVNI